MGQQGTRQAHGPQRMGEGMGEMLDGLAARRSAQRTTTRKPLRRSTATAEEVRAKASATLWWAKGHPSLTAVPSTCPMCHGAGWVRDVAGPENGWRAATHPCACLAELMAHERWERALAASDITPKLLSVSFGSYDTRGHPSLSAGHDAAVAWATAVPDGGAPWLFLYGSPGTGKTHLLASAFNLLMAAGRYPLYTLVPALLDHVRQGLDAPNKGEYAARFKAIKEAPILLLDDLGAEQRSDWSDEALFKLLDYRYREELPTAVASNLLPAGLEPRIASRLQDRALSAAVLMAGPDYRQTGGRSGEHAGRRK